MVSLFHGQRDVRDVHTFAFVFAFAAQLILLTILRWAKDAAFDLKTCKTSRVPEAKHIARPKRSLSSLKKRPMS